ncbi:MAG: sodium:solute symporter [Ignavibacteriales bacterium]|nr:MAG: sodium:solute symporter [Ignavibacteriales bacterium]
MEDRTVDYIIIIAYLTGIAFYGIKSGGRQKSVKEYFLGAEKIPWWVICFSIVAAETSTLTFISIPGLAYLTNLNFLQLTFGYLLGRIIISIFFLPAFYKGELKTAYTFLETRFGSKARSTASITFMFTRIAADGVRLFATAIPLKLMLDISYPVAIVIIAIVALIYTYTGGIRSIIWVDAVQMLIYLGGAITACIYLVNLIPGNISEIIVRNDVASKLNFIEWGFGDSIASFFSKPYTFIGGIIGGAFLSMASHGTDQLIVQRVLAANKLSSSRKALVGSGVIVIIQFFIFLVTGVLLYALFGVTSMKSDEVFPHFILTSLPSGISGIIIAGLFAAAMSTLAGSMSSLSSSFMMDIFLPLKKSLIDEDKKLSLSRVATILFGCLLILSALIFMGSSKAVVEIALSIASFTYGGLLGLFLLGLFNKKINQDAALVAFFTALGVMIFIITGKYVAWTWFTFIGVVITLSVGYVLSLFQSTQNQTNK